MSVSDLEQIIDADTRVRFSAPLEQAWTLPPAAYLDDDVFQAEVAQIFNRDWICVARCDQLPNPGDYVCVDLINQPIVVARDMASGTEHEVPLAELA